MNYGVTFAIGLKEGMLDPDQGPEHGAPLPAREVAGQMCERLLANPVIHHSTIEVE